MRHKRTNKRKNKRRKNTRRKNTRKRIRRFTRKQRGGRWFSTGDIVQISKHKNRVYEGGIICGFAREQEYVIWFPDITQKIDIDEISMTEITSVDESDVPKPDVDKPDVDKPDVYKTVVDKVLYSKNNIWKIGEIKKNEKSFYLNKYKDKFNSDDLKQIEKKYNDVMSKFKRHGHYFYTPYTDAEVRLLRELFKMSLDELNKVTPENRENLMPIHTSSITSSWATPGRLQVEQSVNSAEEE